MPRIKDAWFVVRLEDLHGLKVEACGLNSAKDARKWVNQCEDVDAEFVLLRVGSGVLRREAVKGIKTIEEGFARLTGESAVLRAPAAKGKAPDESEANEKPEQLTGG